MVVSRITSNGNLFIDGFDITPVDSVRLTASGFAAAVRARARAASGGDSLALLVVHGFGTSLTEAWSYAVEAHVRSRSPAPWLVFCWPSNGSGIAWPRRDEILTRAYYEDSVAAVASRSAFSRAMQVVLPAIGGGQLLVVAHSIGAQVVGETLAEDPVLRDALSADPLRGLVFFSPDVATPHFRDVVLPAVTPLTRRVVVYASSDDRVLTLSRAINSSERAGLIRGATPPFDGVETVDATAGLRAESRTQRVVGTHHTMRRASGALFDLAHIVAGSYSAACRASLGTAVPVSAGFWKLTAMQPPSISMLAGCPRAP